MVSKIVQFGCGPIGCSAVRLAAQKSGLEIVGAIDLVNTGKDIGEVAGMDRKLGVTISDDADGVMSKTKPDVVMHTTGSSMVKIFSQLEQIMKQGCNIISTCEELSFPYRTQPELTEKLDKIAKDNGVSVVATGVNPGFVMDAWPLFMTGVCQNVTKIKSSRIQDASSRRIPFQKKIGAGRTPEEFNALIKEGTLKHVGLPESIAMVAAGMGWDLDEITETIEPVMLDTEVSSDFVTVKVGQAAGVKQIGYGIKGGEKLITMEFQAYIGAPESYDAVYVTGTPDMDVVIRGGTHGDLATVAMAVNAIPRIIAAPPGFFTMKDIPMVIAMHS